jgi:hypothetical protein
MLILTTSNKPAISPTAPIALLLAIEIKERGAQFDVQDNDSNRCNSKNRPLQPEVFEITGTACTEAQVARLISTASIIGMSKKNGEGVFVCRILVVKSIQDDVMVIMMAMITTTEEMISKYTSVSLSQSAVCR